MATTTTITGMVALAAASLQSDDLLPIVDVHDTTQAPTGSTKKITVANLFFNSTFTGVSAFANGTFSAPSIAFASDPDTGFFRVSANTIGVAVNGSKIMEIGTTGIAVGAGLSGSIGIQVSSGILTGTAQRGVSSAVTFTSAATAFGMGFSSVPSTIAAAFTMAELFHFYAQTASVGAGSAITTQYGLYVESMTTGGTNYAIYTNAGTVSFGDLVTVRAGGLLQPAASATGGAGFRLPHGAAPTSPVNGDMWTTTAGLFVRVNGSTVGPLS